MYFGLTVSLVAHLALLGWALMSFQTTKPYRLAEPEPVEVAIISADELVRLRQGDRSSKMLETRPAEKIEKKPTEKEAKREIVKTVPPPAAAAPTPSEDPISKKLAALQPVEPKGPTAEEIAAKKAAEEAAKKAAAEKVAEELALQKAAEEKKKQEAEKQRKAEEEKKRQAEAEKKRKAEEQRKRREAEQKRRQQEAERKKRLAEQQKRERERQAKTFDSGRISALLNKIPDPAAPQGGSPDANAPPDAPRGARAGAPEGRDSQLTASQRSLLGAMMKQAVSRCWNINSGLEGADKVIVDLEIRLGQDGRLNGQPVVVNSGRGAIFQDAVNSAIRALIQCEPYDLPQQFYKGGWDHMVITFDPQRMF